MSRAGAAGPSELCVQVPASSSLVSGGFRIGRSCSFCLLQTPSFRFMGNPQGFCVWVTPCRPLRRKAPKKTASACSNSYMFAHCGFRRPTSNLDLGPGTITSLSDLLSVCRCRVGLHHTFWKTVLSIIERATGAHRLLPCLSESTATASGGHWWLSSSVRQQQLRPSQSSTP